MLETATECSAADVRHVKHLELHINESARQHHTARSDRMDSSEQDCLIRCLVARLYSLLQVRLPIQGIVEGPRIFGNRSQHSLRLAPAKVGCKICAEWFQNMAYERPPDSCTRGRILRGQNRQFEQQTDGERAHTDIPAVQPHDNDKRSPF